MYFVFYALNYTYYFYYYYTTIVKINNHFITLNTICYHFPFFRCLDDFIFMKHVPMVIPFECNSTIYVVTI